MRCADSRSGVRADVSDAADVRSINTRHTVCTLCCADFPAALRHRCRVAGTGDELEWPTFGYSFSRRLRLIRNRRNLSQEQLAHRSGLHRNQVSNLERNISGAEGAADPHMSTVYRLARVLDVPPVMLIPDADAPVEKRSGETADELSWAVVEASVDDRMIERLPREVGRRPIENSDE